MGRVHTRRNTAKAGEKLHNTQNARIEVSCSSDNDTDDDDDEPSFTSTTLIATAMATKSRKPPRHPNVTVTTIKREPEVNDTSDSVHQCSSSLCKICGARANRDVDLGDLVFLVSGREDAGEAAVRFIGYV